MNKNSLELMVMHCQFYFYAWMMLKNNIFMKKCEFLFKKVLTLCKRRV